jgi:hypothetical protein
MKTRRSCRPALEILEIRDTPAGTVTGSFANGTWTLVGDAEANDILINPAANPNQFEVTGRNGTAVGGVVSASNVQNIFVQLRAGDDKVQVNSTGTLAGLNGNLRIAGGDGANHVHVDSFKMRNLTITNGRNDSGSDDLNLINTIVQKNVTINNGNGDSDTEIYCGSSVASLIGGNLTVINGVGEDFTYIGDAYRGGDVTVRNGRPDSSNDPGYFGIYNSANDASRSVVGGNVSVRYQGGTVDYDGIWDTEVLGNVRFNYGSGNGQVYFDGSTVALPVHIHGNLTVIGQGNTLVEVGTYSGTGLIVDKNFTVLTGAGSDQITFAHLSVGGATRIVTGAGNDSFAIDDSHFTGPTTVLTGGGLDTVLIERKTSTDYGTQFVKALKVHMGADNDTLTIGSANDRTHLVELFGLAALDGGAGDDTFNRFNLTPGVSGSIAALFETINL